MTVTLDDSGIEELFFDPEGEVAQIMERAAYQVENKAKVSLLHLGTYHFYGPGHYVLFKAGRWYAWDRTGSAHTSSMPGEAPASDMGLLLASISHVMVQTDSGIGADIGSPLDYAFYVELGTKLMEARPYLRPALDVVGLPTFVAPDVAPEAPGRLFYTPISQGHR